MSKSKVVNAKVEKKDEKFVMKGEIKHDVSRSDKMYEVKHNGVTVEWTQNISDALAVNRLVIGSELYTVNMGVGIKSKHVK